MLDKLRGKTEMPQTVYSLCVPSRKNHDPRTLISAVRGMAFVCNAACVHTHDINLATMSHPYTFNEGLVHTCLLYFTVFAA